MTDIIKKIPNTNFGLKYFNVKYRPATNAERYEGYMRGDFSVGRIGMYDSVEVILMSGFCGPPDLPNGRFTYKLPTDIDEETYIAQLNALSP